jgi:hypothetical protein
VWRALACVGVLAFAGCGQDDPEVGVGDTVRSYIGAVKAHDGKKVCASYSKDYLDLIARESNAPCDVQETARTARSPDPALRYISSSRDGDHATAIVDCTDSTASDCSLPLKIEDGEWKVDGSPSPND